MTESKLLSTRWLRVGVASLVVAAFAAALVPAPAEAQAYSARQFARFGKNKIQYKHFDWQIYHAPHFDVYFYSAEEHLLEKIVSMAESAYDHLSQRLDYQIEQPTPLIFYKTHSEFEQNNIFQGFIPEGVGAFATNVRFRMVLPVDLPDAELYKLILHELTHIFQYHILFGGKVGRGLTANAPTWLVEGMASYYAEDESTSDRMFLRDAVVNDIVPPITQARGGGFFAYRFGHAAYDYMEERWGSEGVIDFLYEYRTAIGGSVERALLRAFRISGEDFDAEFRRWLRDKYLPELIATGEPSYFGRKFYDRKHNAQFFSPTVSPSGDLVAAISNPIQDLDIVLLDTRSRRPMRNLTKGWSSEYQFLTAQYASLSRATGNDIAFTPDGNWIGAFAKKEGNRALILVNVLKGGVDRVITLDEVQQPFSIAFHPDGQHVAFAGSLEGQFDIFMMNLETEEIVNLTNDPRWDGGPTFSPDGKRMVYTSESGEQRKLVRMNLDNPDQRVQLSDGDFDDVDPTFSPDGSQLFFTSDRNGFENIYSIDLTTGDVVQHTNAVTGTFQPQVLIREDGSSSLIYGGYWKSRFDIYRSEFQDSLGVIDSISPEKLTDQGDAPLALEEFEPDIQVAIDDANKDSYRRFKLYLEDGDINVGVTSDQRFVSQSFISMADQLGDRRLIIYFASVSSFSDLDVIFQDNSRRWSWMARLYDDRSFYIGRTITEDGLLSRESIFELTGLEFRVQYPFSLNYRAEASVAGIHRVYDFQSFFIDQETGEVIPVITPREDTYPELRLGFTGDTTVNATYGPKAGTRWTVGGSYAPDFEDTGTLTSSLYFDGRAYLPTTRRSGFALRGFAGASWGNFPNVWYFGGLDTIRGTDINSIAGDRAFFANFEYRFPLIDALVFPIMVFQDVRARVFLDVGGAWFDYADQDFNFWDSDNDRLDDGIAAYGWGFSLRWSFMQFNWDFSKAWDFDKTLDDSFRTNFWIGYRF